MSGEAPDIREQEDCPSGDACDWSCDQHPARTPADDAGDVTADTEVEYWQDIVYAERKAAKKAIDEARAEADRLRAEVERLRVENRHLSADAVREWGIDLIAQRDNLRVTLGKVLAVIDSEYVPLPEYRTDVAHGAVQVIDKIRKALAADPVSLADVRADAWDEGSEATTFETTPVNPYRTEAVTDHG